MKINNKLACARASAGQFWWLYRPNWVDFSTLVTWLIDNQRRKPLTPNGYQGESRIRASGFTLARIPKSESCETA